MVLAALDANDPQPRRDDARFQGDYKAFRKADKAWNERERGRRTRQKLVAETAAAALCRCAVTRVMTRTLFSWGLGAGRSPG